MAMHGKTSTGGVREVRKLARDRQLQPSAHVVREVMLPFGIEIDDIAEWIASGRFCGTEIDDPAKGGPLALDGLKYEFRGQDASKSSTICKIFQDETGRKLFVITAEHPPKG